MNGWTGGRLSSEEGERPSKTQDDVRASFSGHRIHVLLREHAAVVAGPGL